MDREDPARIAARLGAVRFFCRNPDSQFSRSRPWVKVSIRNFAEGRSRARSVASLATDTVASGWAVVG